MHPHHSAYSISLCAFPTPSPHPQLTLYLDIIPTTTTNSQKSELYVQAISRQHSFNQEVGEPVRLVLQRVSNKQQLKIKNLSSMQLTNPLQLFNYRFKCPQEENKTTSQGLTTTQNALSLLGFTDNPKHPITSQGLMTTLYHSPITHSVTYLTSEGSQP